MEENIIIQYGTFSITQMDLLLRLLISAGVGFVVGLEREFSKPGGASGSFAGVRTFMLLSVFGYLSALLGLILTPWLFVAGLVGVTGVMLISYFASSRTGKLGITTEVASLIIFLVGGLVLLGYLEIALATTVVILVVLSVKTQLQRLIGRLTQAEIFAFVRFVAIALLVFPVLPNEGYGPGGTINPRELGWIVVLTSGLGFLGYLLTKFLGSSRGMIFSGLLGGLVSSTAVTWVFAHRSRETPELSVHAAAGVISASSLMVIRVGFWLFLFNRELLGQMLIPLGVLLLVKALAAAWLVRRAGQGAPAAEIPLGKPLNLRDALIFAAIYTGITLLIQYSNTSLGAGGILLSSAIGGLTDLDAISISLAKLGQAPVAMMGLVLAMLANTLLKAGVGAWFGSPVFRKYILIGFGIYVVVGSAFLLYWIW